MYRSLMSLKEQLLQDLKQAMLARDVVTRDTLRMIKSEMMNKEVELGVEELDDENLMKILQRGVKTRKETIEQMVTGGRTDGGEDEKAEISVIEKYLPKVMTHDETEAAIVALISEHNFSGRQDMGKLMKELKAKHGAAVDGKLASGIAGKALS